MHAGHQAKPPSQDLLRGEGFPPCQPHSRERNAVCVHVLGGRDIRLAFVWASETAGESLPTQAIGGEPAPHLIGRGPHSALPHSCRNNELGVLPGIRNRSQLREKSQQENSDPRPGDIESGRSWEESPP